MKSNRIKMTAILLLVLPLIALAIFKVNPASQAATFTDEDAAAVYKTKCAMCHKATAEKSFDAAKTDDVLAETVLKGKKTEKPPSMPAYEEKGITKEQALSLVSYMKQLRTAPAK